MAAKENRKPHIHGIHCKNACDAQKKTLISFKPGLLGYLSIVFALGLFIGFIALLLGLIGLCVFLMWQGGWWAMLGLGLWIVFQGVGKLLQNKF